MKRTTKGLAKVELERAADEGSYLADPDYIDYKDLDGTEARRYLESKGFTVAKNYDTGRNGWAITDCGIWLSTNGYIFRK